MKRIMDKDQITAVAREYAEDATKTDAGDPNLSASDLNSIKRDVAEYAEGVISWLLRTHCIVSKEKEAITQEEIEKAATEFADKEYEIGEVDWAALHKGYYHGMKDSLGKREKEAEEAAINGWMARDKNGDLVCCAGSKPFKEEKLPFWRVDYRNYIECIPNDLFPSVTWDSEPMEVEITIKPKKKSSTK